MADQKIKEKEEKLIELVSSFCEEKLNLEYKKISIKMVQKLGRKREVPFKRGKLEIGASGIIYALGQINFLFDKSFEPYSTADEICKFFGTKKTTTSNKARDIRKLLNLKIGDKDFSTKDMEGSMINQKDLTYTKSRRGAENMAMLQMIGEILRRKR